MSTTAEAWATVTCVCGHRQYLHTYAQGMCRLDSECGCTSYVEATP